MFDQEMKSKSKASSDDQGKRNLNDINLLKIVSYKGIPMPESFIQYENQVRDMKIQSDDIWLCAYPRTVKLIRGSSSEFMYLPHTNNHETITYNDIVVMAVADRIAQENDTLPTLSLESVAIPKNFDHWVHSIEFPNYKDLLLQFSKGCKRSSNRLSTKSVEISIQAVILYRFYEKKILELGSNWSQEMVWCIANNVDLEAAKIKLADRFPDLEASIHFSSKHEYIEELSSVKYIKNSFNYVANLPSPRFIKTHLPFQFLPMELQQNKTKAKIIYVTRNPRDACISRFNLWLSYKCLHYDFDTFCEAFLEGNLYYGPFWDHVFSFWERRQSSNILILKYEDMKKDLKSNILKVAEFLDKTLNEEQVAKLLDHLSLEKMKNNPAVNREEFYKLLKKHNLMLQTSEPFIRAGRVDGWRQVMNARQIESFKNWEIKNLKKADESFVKFFGLNNLE